MLKHAPHGLGGWVAFEKSLDPGDKMRDLVVAIDRCRRAGMSWIAPRAGAGGANDAAFDEVSVAAYVAAGLQVYPWIFPYVNTEPRVAAGFRRFFVAGAHGAIINAEFEYQPATASQALSLVGTIRTAWAEAQGERLRRGLPVVADEPFIAHAPPDYLGAGVGHALSDELVALDEVCDAIMPQVYAWEHDDRGHAFHLERVARGYEKRGIPLERIWWIGCTYRPKTRGFDTAGKARPTPPMFDEALRVADDAVAFLDHELVRACPAPSFYSLDAISWINGAADRVMSALEQHAARRLRDTLPAPAPSEPPVTEPQTPRSRSSHPRMPTIVLPSAATPLRAGEGEHTVEPEDVEL